MKLFELADAVSPMIPGDKNRPDKWREFIASFTWLNVDDLKDPNDPAVFVTDETYKSMNSRDSAFTQKLAKALFARLDTNNFIDLLFAQDEATQALIIENVRAYGEYIDPDDFAYQIAELLVRILHEKGKIKEDLATRLRKMRIHAQRVRNKDLVLARSRGCARCKAALKVTSHDQVASSYTIVFLDTEDEIPTNTDFAAMCKPCAEKFELSHIPEEANDLRAYMCELAALEEIEGSLAPLDLDEKIKTLLHRINDVPELSKGTPSNYKVVDLAEKIEHAGLLRRCRDLMANYEHVVREHCKALVRSGELDFDQMCGQISSAWYVMRDRGLTQDKVWNQLTAWVDENTKVDTYAAGIVVTFMIQICEVFKPSKAATL